jgi:uncharacterized membrane protein
VCGPAAWPWYLTWGLVLLAVGPEGQASRWIPMAMVLSPLVVKADGILAFPLHTAPAFVVLYVAIAVVALRRRPTVAASRLRPVAEA